MSETPHHHEGKPALVSDAELCELIKDDDLIYTATQIFDALSDYTRFRIRCIPLRMIM